MISWTGDSDPVIDRQWGYTMSSTDLGPEDPGGVGPGSPGPGNRGRTATIVVVLLVVLALVIAGVLWFMRDTGQAPEPGESATPSESATATPSETPSPTDATSPSDDPSDSATAVSTASPSPTGEASPGPTETASETYTTESGLFTWTLPPGWTASRQDYDEDLLDWQGVPYEEVLFQGPEGVEFHAITGMGPTSNDGPKPEVVEVLEAQELPHVPVSEAEGVRGTGPVWYRAALYRAGADLPDPQAFDGAEFILSVHVVNIDEDLDPEATDQSYWSSWFYREPAAEGFEAGAASSLYGSITQATAEELTGLAGEEAMRAVLETEEYAQLRELATSVEVGAVTGP